jgi:2'-5' RNA ligase
LTRVFVAVAATAAVLDAVEAASALLELPATARRTTRDQWHVTLQFLGNHADVDAVADALARLAVSGGEARLGGAGAFPNQRRGRVLWLGLCDGAELLQQLASAVGVLLTPLGHEPEARSFHPHLTLARCKTTTDLRPIVAALGPDPVGPAWTVSEVVVFESQLRRDGAQYIPRARIPLR